jgi:hypothetical protein
LFQGDLFLRSFCPDLVSQQQYKFFVHMAYRVISEDQDNQNV